MELIFEIIFEFFIDLLIDKDNKSAKKWVRILINSLFWIVILGNLALLCAIKVAPGANNSKLPTIIFSVMAGIFYTIGIINIIVIIKSKN